jgi:signal transduction histidine kinase
MKSVDKELIKENNERLQIEKKILDHQKQLQSLTSLISLIEENEKRRIATELHDCIGQNLALSKIKLGQLGKSANSEGLKNDIGEILKIIEHTITETRTLTFELSPPIL